MAEHPRQAQGELSWQVSCQRSDTLAATDGRSVAKVCSAKHGHEHVVLADACCRTERASPPNCRPR